MIEYRIEMQWRGGELQERMNERLLQLHNVDDTAVDCVRPETLRAVEIDAEQRFGLCAHIQSDVYIDIADFDV